MQDDDGWGRHYPQDLTTNRFMRTPLSYPRSQPPSRESGRGHLGTYALGVLSGAALVYLLHVVLAH